MASFVGEVFQRPSAAVKGSICISKICKKSGSTQPSSEASQDPSEREPRHSMITKQKPARKHRVSRNQSREERLSEIEMEIKEGFKAYTEAEEEATVVEEERRVDNMPSYTKLFAHIKNIKLSSMRCLAIASLIFGHFLIANIWDS
ncbi:Uncharacterized protein Rs2_35477 [Raphanus sativus]|nr:Uncharacterized protein Rs2_35477 [Raphanus sativus]